MLWFGEKEIVLNGDVWVGFFEYDGKIVVSLEMFEVCCFLDENYVDDLIGLIVDIEFVMSDGVIWFLKVWFEGGGSLLLFYIECLVYEVVLF